MDFKEISIRGRFGYALLCIKSYIDFYELNSSIEENIFLNLSTFTNTTQLDEWYEKCKVYDPTSYRNSINFSNINATEYSKLKTYYLKLPENLFTLYQNAFDIAIEHLYSRVNSDITITYLEDSINILKRHSISIPKLKMDILLSFNERNGWGLIYSWNKVFGDNK